MVCEKILSKIVATIYKVRDMFFISDYIYRLVMKKLLFGLRVHGQGLCRKWINIKRNISQSDLEEIIFFFFFF